MLDQIPSEILTQITTLLIHKTDLTPPLNLLLTCRSIYTSISPKTNPLLYAKIFGACFDLEAPFRRARALISGRVTPEVRKGGIDVESGIDISIIESQDVDMNGSKDEDESDSDSSSIIGAKRIVQELKKRVIGLRRLKRMIEKGDVTGISEDDLWLIYLMLIEDDGKNWQYFKPGSGIIDLSLLIRLYRTQISLENALGSGFVEETAPTSLIVWIEWLTVCKASVVGSSDNDDGNYRIEAEKLDEASSTWPEIDPVAPDLESTSELIFILRPFVFVPQKYDISIHPWTSTHIPPSPSRSSSFGINRRIDSYNPQPRKPCTIQYFGSILQLAYPVLSHAAILRFFQKQGTDPNSPDIGIMKPIVGSIVHDRDILRLVKCARPIGRIGGFGMKARDWRGCWNGSWEGTFSFLEFQSFRDMLLGDERAVFEGPCVIQAQVWKLRETFIRPTLNSRFPTFQQQQQQHQQPFTGSMLDAGFASLPDLELNLNTPSAEIEANEEVIKRQVEACPGYEKVPEEELEMELERDEIGDGSGLELLINGTGHSAWGRFIVRGRVRLWDGLAVIIKEYTPNLRGRWVYRGYLSTDNVYVGRWRDSITADDLIGYEGTFTLTRRQ